MSIKNSLIASLRFASAKLAGAHLTRMARDRFCIFFSTFLHAAGFRHVRTIADIRMRHVRLFLAERTRSCVSPRTVCNQTAHLRGLMRVGGNHQVLKDLSVPNKALGIPPSSRQGTKFAMDEPEFTALLKRVRCSNLRAILCLERAIGLRAMEALRAGPCLLTWRAQITAGMKSLDVLYGTKGGRVRTTRMPDPERALEAIENAISVMGKYQRLAPTRTLKQAAFWYRNAMYRLGVQGHRLRYTFACECVDTYLASGMLEKEAFARTAMDLGHGDGRGRWVKMVYYRQRSSEKL